MNRALTLIVAGWLLVHHNGPTIAWYETKEDCEFAFDYSPGTTWNRCVPDRFAVEEMRRPQEQTK